MSYNDFTVNFIQFDPCIIKFHAQGNNGGLDEVQTHTQQAINWSDPTGNQLVTFRS